ncbi:MAG TPA: Asp23/Gls24 family envelope stress response protein [Anaerolineae bacterium]|nr:Asp23/Gls24 family envelope stress response protein [Anaerolineae bacterium]
MAAENVSESATAPDVGAGLAPAHRGRVTVAQRVLDAIAQLTTLNVPGVVRLATRGGLRRGSDGVRVDVVDDKVFVDVYVIVTHDANMRQIGKEIQVEIARAMNQIVGMDAAEVNVHIQDVEPPAA